MVVQLNNMGEPIVNNVVITKIIYNLPIDYWHVISMWDNVPNAMKTLENLIVRLLKEETFTKSFLE
jgi:hypothetical protein